MHMPSLTRLDESVFQDIVVEPTVSRREIKLRRERDDLERRSEELAIALREAQARADRAVGHVICEKPTC